MRHKKKSEGRKEGLQFKKSTLKVFSNNTHTRISNLLLQNLQEANQLFLYIPVTRVKPWVTEKGLHSFRKSLRLSDIQFNEFQFS